MSSDGYAHIVEEDVHPFQGLCGAEVPGNREGPMPPICPKCLDLYAGITDPKSLEVPEQS